MIGQTLLHYRINFALGAGGMGEVYRATDTNLGRDVAIKVLPSEVTQDEERLARFRREAHLLAALNHPNIAAIHGLEEADGKPFLVLELVEGEDLSVRLRRGAIPIDESLEIARQIAEALEEAHAKGIVHRDLKPANVKLTPDGPTSRREPQSRPRSAAAGRGSGGPGRPRLSSLPGSRPSSPPSTSRRLPRHGPWRTSCSTHPRGCRWGSHAASLPGPPFRRMAATWRSWGCRPAARRSCGFAPWARRRLVRFPERRALCSPSGLPTEDRSRSLQRES